MAAASACSFSGWTRKATYKLPSEKAAAMKKTQWLPRCDDKAAADSGQDGNNMVKTYSHGKGGSNFFFTQAMERI